MISLTQKSWSEINKEVAVNVANLRKRKKISQAVLADKSGVSLGSIKRFEQTGEISLQSLTKIAIALDSEKEIDGLFKDVPFASIQEIIDFQHINSVHLLSPV